MNKFFLNKRTPKEINTGIAERLKLRRKKSGLTQAELSEKSGVSLGSIKRFERLGEISLISLTKVTIALECSEELNKLFTEPPLTSIQEVIDGQD